MAETRTEQAVAAPRLGSSARLLDLAEGVYAVTIAEVGGTPGQVAGMTVPAILVSVPLLRDVGPPEIVGGSAAAGSWLGQRGGTVIVRAPPGGSSVLVTSFSASPAEVLALRIEIRPVDDERGGAVPAGAAAAPGRPVAVEIAAHIEGHGDRRFAGEGWAGERGRGLRLEGFAVRAIEELAADGLEVMGFGPGGERTLWLGGDRLCGTRGQGRPLTGFAVRLRAELRGRFTVAYEGAFFVGGIVGPCRDGEPCRSFLVDDPLEAIRVRLFERFAPEDSPPGGAG
jgi:hypothetical protein